jgi:hypothetical protein
MGVGGADSTGVFAAVGVASIPSDGVLAFVDPASVEEKIGDGPLRDLIVSALSVAKTTVYAIALEGSVPGSVSAVKAGSENAGTGTIAVSGKPRNEYDVLVDITASGTLNEAAFRVTIDENAGKIITVPDGEGKYEIPGTGLTLRFTPGEDGFEEGDAFSFSTTEPKATNGEILAAADQILDAKLSIEWIAVAGVSGAPLWTALATKAEGAAEVYRYLFFVAQARYQTETETADRWAMALAGAERGAAALDAPPGLRGLDRGSRRERAGRHTSAYRRLLRPPRPARSASGAGRGTLRQYQRGHGAQAGWH